MIRAAFHRTAVSMSPVPARPSRSKPAAPPLGLRERGKQDKRRRISEAARAVFIENGYEAATTREIAARADVSVGTVFLYAKDKRDLLLLIVNDELDALTAKGEARPPGTGSLLDDLGAFFRARYRYWASEPQLSRPTVRETFEVLEGAATQGVEARRFSARRTRLLAQLVALVEQARVRGEVAADIAPETAAALILDIYLIEVRRWLHQAEPKVNAGMARLLDMLGLAMRGLAAAAPPAARAKRRPAKVA